MDLPSVILAIAIILAIATVPSFFQSPADRYKDRNPTVVSNSTSDEAMAAANADAKAYGGRAYSVADTGSMWPTLKGGQYIVGKKVPYEELKVGDVINYTPAWNEKKLTAHRLVQKDKDGWLLSGDNNARTESWMRVTPDNYVDKVVRVYNHPDVKQDDPKRRQK